jgi:hypothetical protein
MKHFLPIVGCAIALAGTSAFGQDEANEGAVISTMTVIPESAELPDAVTKELVLPDEASEAAREHSAEGLAKANAARIDGRAFGQATAAAAREHAQDTADAAVEAAHGSAEAHEIALAAREDGRAFGEATAAAAAASREDLAHATRPDLGSLLPGDLPDSARVPDHLPATPSHP